MEVTLPESSLKLNKNIDIINVSLNQFCLYGSYIPELSLKIYSFIIVFDAGIAFLRVRDRVLYSFILSKGLSNMQLKLPIGSFSKYQGPQQMSSVFYCNSIMEILNTKNCTKFKIWRKKTCLRFQILTWLIQYL